MLASLFFLDSSEPEQQVLGQFVLNLGHLLTVGAWFIIVNFAEARSQLFVELVGLL